MVEYRPPPGEMASSFGAADSSSVCPRAGLEGRAPEGKMLRPSKERNAPAEALPEDSGSNGLIPLTTLKPDVIPYDRGGCCCGGGGGWPGAFGKQEMLTSASSPVSMCRKRPSEVSAPLQDSRALSLRRVIRGETMVRGEQHLGRTAKGRHVLQILTLMPKVLTFGHFLRWWPPAPLSLSLPAGQEGPTCD